MWRVLWAGAPGGGDAWIPYRMEFNDKLTAVDNLQAIRLKYPGATLWRWTGIQWIRWHEKP